MKVYVATIDTKYEVIGVAETEAEAIRLAADKAYEFLKNGNALYPETDTPQKIIDYFSPTVTGIEIGSAGYVGDQ